LYKIVAIVKIGFWESYLFYILRLVPILSNYTNKRLDFYIGKRTHRQVIGGETTRNDTRKDKKTK
jgi:hypothetical protein